MLRILFFQALEQAPLPNIEGPLRRGTRLQINYDACGSHFVVMVPIRQRKRPRRDGIQIEVELDVRFKSFILHVVAFLCAKRVEDMRRSTPVQDGCRGVCHFGSRFKMKHARAGWMSRSGSFWFKVQDEACPCRKDVEEWVISA